MTLNSSRGMPFANQAHILYVRNGRVANLVPAAFRSPPDLEPAPFWGLRAFFFPPSHHGARFLGLACTAPNGLWGTAPFMDPDMCVTDHIHVNADGQLAMFWKRVDARNWVKKHGIPGYRVVKLEAKVRPA